MGEIETEHNRHQRTSNFLKAFIDQYTFEKSLGIWIQRVVLQRS